MTGKGGGGIAITRSDNPITKSDRSKQMKANKDHLGYVGRKPGSRNSNAWFTPNTYVNLVRKVLGDIDLDPFSCSSANRTIKARRFFCEKRSAFENEWNAKTVFMNPPYSTGLISRSVDRFLEMRHRYHFTAIVLVNNATETKWFQALLESAQAICFPNHRISFETSDNKSSSGNTRGQAFFYFGQDQKLFTTIFSTIGVVL